MRTDPDLEMHSTVPLPPPIIRCPPRVALAVLSRAANLDGYRFATWLGVAILFCMGVVHIAGRFGWL